MPPGRLPARSVSPCSANNELLLKFGLRVSPGLHHEYLLVPALACEQEVIKTITDGNAYAKKNLKDQDDTVSKDGSLKFWSY